MDNFEKNELIKYLKKLYLYIINIFKKKKMKTIKWGNLLNLRTNEYTNYCNCKMNLSSSLFLTSLFR